MGPQRASPARAAITKVMNVNRILKFKGIENVKSNYGPLGN